MNKKKGEKKKRRRKQLPNYLVTGVTVIELTQGQVTLVDTADLDKVNQYHWCAKKIPKYKDRYHAMAHATNEYGRGTTVSLHRVIMDCPKGKQVDHINGDSLDNRRANLRICTCSENLANTEKSVNNSSGYRGVYWSKAAGKWVATLGYQGKQLYLGVFDDPRDAARAYDREKLKRFGQFAKTNGLE